MNELLPIGEAAARLGLAPSALRYYEERGLVAPRDRHGGRRRYGPEEMRRLAFLTVARRLGLPLEVAGGLLDAAQPRWRADVQAQLDELARLAERIRTTQAFLGHALDCPAAQPVRDCPVLTAALDELVAGTPVDEVVSARAEA